MLHLSAVVLVLPEPGAPAGPWLRRGKAQNKMPSSFVVVLPGALCAVLHLGQPTRWWQRGLCCSGRVTSPGCVCSAGNQWGLMTFLWTELHCYSRVQWHWHHHSINPQWHQPSGKEEDGSRAGVEGKWTFCVRHTNSEIKHNSIVGIMWCLLYPNKWPKIIYISELQAVPQDCLSRVFHLLNDDVEPPVLRWGMQAVRICWETLKLLPVKNLKLMKTLLLLLSFYMDNRSEISCVATTFLTLYWCCLISWH